MSFSSSCYNGTFHTTWILINTAVTTTHFTLLWQPHISHCCDNHRFHTAVTTTHFTLLWQPHISHCCDNHTFHTAVTTTHFTLHVIYSPLRYISTIQFVGIVIRLRYRRPRDLGTILGRSKRFISITFLDPGGPRNILSNGYLGFILWNKAAEVWNYH